MSAKAQAGEQLLLAMIASDVRVHYLGEFCGQPFHTDHLVGLKAGGTFHIALDARLPETGSPITSTIHWDMICDVSRWSNYLPQWNVYFSLQCKINEDEHMSSCRFFTAQESKCRPLQLIFVGFCSVTTLLALMLQYENQSESLKGMVIFLRLISVGIDAW